MPEISTFYGIVVRMFYGDHAPPHFHAQYGDCEVLVYIESGLIEGKFPRRALALVLEWLDAHRDELLANWQRVVQKVPLVPIDPLS